MAPRPTRIPPQRTQELTKQLAAHVRSATKVLDALQSAHTQMESLRQDTSLSQQDRRAKMMDIHKNTARRFAGSSTRTSKRVGRDAGQA